MKYTGMEFLWLFLVYSFLGWVLETAAGTIKKKRFTNRGFTTGPFCGVYGTAAVLMAAALQELRGNPVFLFLGCAAVATAVEWITGKTLERLNRKNGGIIRKNAGISTGISAFPIPYSGESSALWLSGGETTFLSGCIMPCRDLRQRQSPLRQQQLCSVIQRHLLRQCAMSGKEA